MQGSFLALCASFSCICKQAAQARLSDLDRMLAFVRRHLGDPELSPQTLAEHMQVSVVASPYEPWPLPWYLRTMPDVGYWAVAGDPVAMRAPVIVASTDFTGALESLGDRYVSEFFGVRPEVLVTLYVERGLWDRFLARAALGGT